MANRSFYLRKTTLFFAIYLLLLTCIMQGDSFFKGLHWLHDISTSISFQQIEDVFDDSSHRFAKSVSIAPSAKIQHWQYGQFFIFFIGSTYYFHLKTQYYNLLISLYLKKELFLFSSTKLYLKHCILIC